jgi:hypothetical protein
LILKYLVFVVAFAALLDFVQKEETVGTARLLANLELGTTPL